MQKSLKYKLGSSFLIAGLMLGAAQAASSKNPDPYADSVESTRLVVQDANNALGKPNGTGAVLAGLGSSITLDMGEGEEGTRSLRVYFSNVNVALNLKVEFLDANKAIISSGQRQLSVNMSANNATFDYNWQDFKKAYRYVRIGTELGVGLNIDAVEAMGYLGSTPTNDTDGDGHSDVDEQDEGTNPLDSNDHPQEDNNTSNPPDSSGNDNDDDDNNSNNNNGNNNNNPGNNTGNDSNNNGSDNNQEDNNNNEDRIDTDGDGMPDKWERENGTDPLKNDADADPDNDFLTNLGEYRYGTNPLQGDDLHDVFCSNDLLSKYPLLWLLLAFGLGLILGNHKKIMNSMQKTNSEKIVKKSK